MGELIGNQPSDSLVEYLRLVVYTLDREEDFAKRMRMHDIQLPFRCQPCTVLNEGRGDFRVGGEGGEEEDHAKSIVYVADSINKGGVPGNDSGLGITFNDEERRNVPLLDDMV